MGEGKKCNFYVHSDVKENVVIININPPPPKMKDIAIILVCFFFFFFFFFDVRICKGKEPVQAEPFEPSRGKTNNVVAEQV